MIINKMRKITKLVVNLEALIQVKTSNVTLKILKAHNNFPNNKL